jgi:hypothetical protein
MITTDQLVRETFAAEAEIITMPADMHARVGRLARRYRVRRAVAVTAATAAAAAIAVAVPMAASSFGPTDASPPAAASTAYDTWAPRGDLGDDLAFAAAATASWDAATAGTHTDVHVLWADTFATGRAAVLAGTDVTGVRRLAVLAGATPSLSVLRDVAAPVELNQLSFNLFVDDEEHSAESYRDTLVVITPPASGWTVEWAGGTDPSTGAGTAGTSDGIAVIDISQSGPSGHPTIRVLDGSKVVYDGPIGSQS